jgi:hypothetical protein
LPVRTLPLKYYSKKKKKQKKVIKQKGTNQNSLLLCAGERKKINKEDSRRSTKVKLVPRYSLLTPPLARTIAIIAAASITHDNGFHIKLKNFKNLFSCIIINQWFPKLEITLT